MGWDDPEWQAATAQLRETRCLLASYPSTFDVERLRAYIDAQLANSMLSPRQRLEKTLRRIARGTEQ